MEFYGSIRIYNPKTLQKWIDRGWYKTEIDNGYVFNVGCGRFRKSICTCSDCRKNRNQKLKEVLLKNNLL